MDVPQGGFVLARPDQDGRAPLRAWDAADELVLAHLAEALDGDDPSTGGADGSGAPVVLVVGDTWGALACALADRAPTVVVDSHLGAAAIAANAAANGQERPRLIGPLDPWPERVDVAVLKVPKAGATLDHALHRLAPSLHPGSVVVGAGMTRHVHTSTLQAFERWVGPTTTSRAVKKARLVHAVPAGRAAGPAPWPRTATVEVPGGAPLAVTAHAGVFAGARLDAGTALLLRHLVAPHTSDVPDAAGRAEAGPTAAAIGTWADVGSVVDLGCGTGIVGAVLGRLAPDAEVTFVDDSALAVASARATWSAAHGDRPATFVHGDALTDPAPITADLVVVNPPFHRDHAVGDRTAWRMFQQARDALPVGGRLVVVGNRHLAHHAKLARLFGKDHVAVLGSDPAYVVLAATR